MPTNMVDLKLFGHYSIDLKANQQDTTQFFLDSALFVIDSITGLDFRRSD